MRIPAPASHSDEHLYYPTTTGHIFACSKVTDARARVPFYGVVLLTRSGSPIDVTIDGHRVVHPALAVHAQEYLVHSARDVVTIAANPLHRNFRAFAHLPRPGFLKLELNLFASHDRNIARAIDGTLTHGEALDVFEGVQSIVRPLLPELADLDPRGRMLIRELWDRPRCTVSDLARRLNLSYHRTSHLFTHSVGISMRTYQLWQKLYRAGAPLLAGASLTDAAAAAGFVDSAHYSSAFQRAYGRPPSHLFRNPRVAIYSTNPICALRRSQVEQEEASAVLST